VIDLSNNNATGHSFQRAHAHGGQLRVMLKLVEGTGFTDPTFAELRSRALAAGMRVGAYDFLRPLAATPAEAADFLLRRLPPLKRHRDLRPALDAESGKPSPQVGRWVSEVARLVRSHTGTRPLVYGSAGYLAACEFPAPPGPLWLAAYGRNDGREHPVGPLPHPWRVMAAHQFTSQGRVLGIDGLCDVSHVFRPELVELPRLLALPRL
jgi:GH25 family lysozyme M1 (1,4-beta-N-acetylmuramidase)